jgi:DNA-binding NarL/FixJ family response regulator
VSKDLRARTAVLVDQHPLFLVVLEQHVVELGFDVVGKFTSTNAAAESLDTLVPELLVTGLEMPPDGLEATALIREARRRAPDIRAIVLSVANEAALVEAAFAAGADAFVLKTAHPDDLTCAIRQAFAHSIYLAGNFAPRPRDNDDNVVKIAAGPRLTRRELEILQLVAEGHSNAELARMLWVTEQTVKFHLSNVYRKLNVSNRTEASRWAQLHGILPSHRLSATI